MFSKGNQGSLNCSSHPGVSPASPSISTLPSPRGTKAQEGQEEPPKPPAPRTALCSPRYSCHICPALLGTCSGKQPWTYCSRSLSHPAPSGCSHILCCPSAWAFHLGLLQEEPWTEIPDPWCVARLPRKPHTPHFSQNSSAMSWGRSTWPQRREGAGRLPQPCPKTQTFGLRVLEHEQSPKKSKKSRH